MTAVAVCGDGLLRLPVTVETGRMIRRCRFEGCILICVTDRAVVVILLLWRRRVCESHVLRRVEEVRDHVLVFVVRKLDRELQVRRRVAKSISRFVTRRSLRMAYGTDLRTRAFEKLRSMTTDACGVIGVVGDVRELRRIFTGNDVAGFAFGLMLFCRVGKLGIVDSLPKGNTDECDQDY